MGCYINDVLDKSESLNGIEMFEGGEDVGKYLNDW